MAKVIIFLIGHFSHYYSFSRVVDLAAEDVM